MRLKIYPKFHFTFSLLVSFWGSTAFSQTVAGIDLGAIQNICRANSETCLRAIDTALSELRNLRSTGRINAAEESTILAALSAIMIDTNASAPEQSDRIADTLQTIAEEARNPDLMKLAAQIRQGTAPRPDAIRDVFASAN